MHLAMAAVAAAALVGTSGSGPVRILDRDLKPVAGTPKLPAKTDGTLRSPNGKRLATYRFGKGTISVRNARTGRVLRKLKTGDGVEAFWPTDHHIVAVTYENGAKRNVIRSFNIRTGKARVVRLAGEPYQIEQDGRVTRLLLAEGEPGLPGSFTVAEVGPYGGLRRDDAIPLPAGMEAGKASVRMQGDRLLASQDGQHALITLDGVATPLDLADGEWDWLGDDLIDNGFEVVQIDRDTGALGARVSPAPDEYLYPAPDGGFFVGIGTQRYDRDLRLVAENDVPVNTEYSPIVFSGSRFYALAYDCTRLGEDFRMVIGSAATGRILKERPGDKWQVGRLDAGYFDAARYDIDCD